jgi:hypothetical protein
MRRDLWIAAIVMFCGVAVEAGDLDGLFRGGLEHPAIEYATRPPRDAIAELNRKLREGAATLQFQSGSGYLRPVLEALGVPVESQMAVFSKTSLQGPIIGPRNPRTIFFNDTVVVAWVRGEPFVEAAAQDPAQGVIFYTLDQRAAELPQFTRRDSCLTCHESYSSLGVPGMLVRSVFPASDGAPLRQLGDFQTDHRSPVEQRWGGWYVTGKFGAVHHLGNAVVTNAAWPEAMVTNETLNLESMAGKFDVSGYLSPYSDVAALLVFEHQMRMMNLLTRAGWEVRLALHEGRADAVTQVSRETAREVVDYLLFVDEAPLTGWVRSTSGFAAKFSAQGPRDRNGRSLRDLDLERRLMRYRCSYMIYAPAFDALPAEAKTAIYQRMWDVLRGAERSPLGLAERRAIVEILRATKKGLPDYFSDVTR